MCGPGSRPASIARLVLMSAYGAVAPVVRMVVTPEPRLRCGAAPVPSITVTLVSATTGSLTVTKSWAVWLPACPAAPRAATADRATRASVGRIILDTAAVLRGSSLGKRDRVRHTVHAAGRSSAGHPPSARREPARSLHGEHRHHLRGQMLRDVTV